MNGQQICTAQLIMGKIIENYNLQVEIGKGAYSTVFKALNMKTQEQVAIKMVHADKFKECPKLEEGSFNEVNILSNLEPSQHIIKYIDMLKTTNNYYFVYEFCNGGCLERFLKQHGALPQRIALGYFAQIIEAFKILNKHNIMHRDLKPQNLLLHNGVIKLADFGFCKPLETEDQISKTMLGSPIYMAPEILKGETYTIKADIWSLGVVLFRMLFGYCPFESSNIAKLILVVEQEQLVIPQKPVINLETQKLLRRMLTKNAKQRADWSEIFSYQVVNGILQQKRCSPDVMNPLKESLATTDTVTVTLNHKMRSPGKVRSPLKPPIKEPEKKNEGGHHRHNSELRNTVSGKVPLSTNFKRDLLLKSHSKLIEVLSLAISLVAEQQNVTVSLAYLMLSKIEREMKSITESARKELQIKQQDAIMRSFNLLIEQEIAQIKKIMNDIEKELEGQSIELKSLVGKQKQLLREWVSRLPKGKSPRLVLGCRVVDYVCDELVIKRQTYEKMNEQKLQVNMLSKLAE